MKYSIETYQDLFDNWHNYCIKTLSKPDDKELKKKLPMHTIEFQNKIYSLRNRYCKEMSELDVPLISGVRDFSIENVLYSENIPADVVKFYKSTLTRMVTLFCSHHNVTLLSDLTFSNSKDKYTVKFEYQETNHVSPDVMFNRYFPLDI